MKSLTMSVLTKLYNKTEDELSELIFEGEGDDIKAKDDALDTLLALDEARIKRIKNDASGDATKKFDDGYKKANKEVMSKIESEFKEKTGFDSDLTGIDLFIEYAKSAGKGKITPENIKSHPEFLKIEKEWNDSHNEELDRVSGEFESYKSSVEKDKVMGRVRSDIKKHFLGLNPVLSDDPARREEQTNMFLGRFNRWDYDFDDDGDIIIMDGDKRLEDNHGNRIRIDGLVKDETTKVFDLSVQNKKESPGNKNEVATAPSKTAVSKEEYNKLAEEAYNSGDRDQIVGFREKYTIAE